MIEELDDHTRQLDDYTKVWVWADKLLYSILFNLQSQIL